MTASICNKKPFSTAHKLIEKPNWQSEPAKVVSTILYSKLFVSFSNCVVIVVQKNSSGDKT